MGAIARRPATIWKPASPEALALAGALRTARLTLLQGTHRGSTTPLLTDGLLPLLQRRTLDAIVTLPRIDEPVLMPFPERRGAARTQPSEIIVLLDGEGDGSWNRLRAQIHAALRAAGVDAALAHLPLAEWLTALGTQFRLRFLIVFDHVEDLLVAPAAERTRDKLFDDLVSVIGSRAPAHVLLAINGDAASGQRLQGVLERVPGIEPARVQLKDDGRRGETTKRAGALHRVATPPVVEGTPVVAVAVAAAVAPQSAPAASASAPVQPTPPFAQIPAAPPISATTPRRAATGRRQAAVAALAVVVVVCVTLVALVSRPSTTPQVADAIAIALVAPVAPVPLPAAAPVAAAIAPVALDLLVDAEAAGTDSRLPDELARATRADGGPRLRVAPAMDVIARLLDGADTPRLAIARYDALTAARGQGIAVIAPLYTEELRVAARIDSPLEFIHQIKGRRLNIGPPGQARALTAATLYRQMFDAAVPASTQRGLDARSALAALTEGRGLDAVVLVTPRGAAALDVVPLELRGRIKWLRLDPQHPASRRARQAYLPVALNDPAPGSTTAATTLASVAFLITSQAADARQPEALAGIVQALCRSLPALQRDSDPKWREVQAGLELPTGLPAAASTRAAWRECSASAAAAGSPSTTPDTLVSSPPLQGAPR